MDAPPPPLPQLDSRRSQSRRRLHSRRRAGTARNGARGHPVLHPRCGDPTRKSAVAPGRIHRSSRIPEEAVTPRGYGRTCRGTGCSLRTFLRLSTKGVQNFTVRYFILLLNLAQMMDSWMNGGEFLSSQELRWETFFYLDYKSKL